VVQGTQAQVALPQGVGPQGLQTLAFESQGIAIPKTVAPVLLLLLVLLAQSISGNMLFFGDALVVGLYLLLVMQAMVLGYAVPVDTHGRLRSLPRVLPVALVVAALLSTLVAWVQVLDWGVHWQWITRMPDLRRPGGNIAQPNHLASLLLMAVVVVWYGYETRRLAAGTALLLVLWLLSGVVLSESRTALVSTWAIALWWWCKRSATGSRLHAGWLGLLCLGLPLAMWVWPPILAWLQGDGLLQSLGSDRLSASPGTRAAVWPVLWDAALDKPWWGWGFGGVSAAQNALAHQSLVSDNFTYAHNLLLDLLVWTGFPATLLVLLAVVFWWLGRLRNIQRKEDWFLLAWVLPVAVHSMFEFPHAYAYFLVPVFFAVGMLEKARNAGHWVLGRLQFGALLAALIMVSAWTVVEYVALEQDFRDARFQSFKFSHSDTAEHPPQALLLTQLEALNAATRVRSAPGMDASTLELLRTVAIRFPSALHAMRYAAALALHGNLPEATRQLQVLRALYGDRVYQAVLADWRQSPYSALAKYVAPQSAR
jgi:O-antigen ligase